jgi:hypothetical protein
MADWTGSARSNYVRFTDVLKARKAIDDFGNLEIIESKCKIGIMSNDEYGGWPSFYSDDNPISIYDGLVPKLKKLLAPKETMIMMEVGAEKMRYLTGTACSFSNKGKIKFINLSDIYNRVRNLNTCEY